MNDLKWWHIALPLVVIALGVAGMYLGVDTSLGASLYGIHFVLFILWIWKGGP